MSDDVPLPVSLECFGRQQKRLLAEARGVREEIGGLRDDMGVLAAIVLRHEGQLERVNASLAEMVNQMRMRVSQHQRFDRRPRALEDERQ
jgi:hypothetical protein